MPKFFDVEFKDYQNLHDILVSLCAYEIVLIEKGIKDFPFYTEILSQAHYKDTKTYKIRVHNLLGDQ